MARESLRARTNAKKGNNGKDNSGSSSEERESEERMELDEEMGRSRSRTAEKTIESSGDDGGDDDDEETSEEGSDDEDAPPVEYMVTQRARRTTAGNKMALLLTNTEHEDEFYKTAYGGFEENNEVDKEYESPPSSDEDEVDSDFDRPEDENEPTSDSENNNEDRPRRKKNRFKEPKRGMTADDVLAKNKKWAMARLAGNMVAANTVDEKTQEKMLKESEHTERLNIESLRRYEEFELEKKKRREKCASRVLPYPRTTMKITREGTTVTLHEIKKFERERPRERLMCAVTGRPARYKDPVTGLPYSTPFAFKVLRDQYHRHLKELAAAGDATPDVVDYLRRWEQLPSPPLSPGAESAERPMATTTSASNNDVVVV